MAHKAAFSHKRNLPLCQLIVEELDGHGAKVLKARGHHKKGPEQREPGQLTQNQEAMAEREVG